MKFFVAFVSTLACAFASPSYYPAYAPVVTPYAGAYVHAPAPVTVLPSGFLADTPEVAHAKAAHLAEVAKSKSTYAPAPYGYPVPYAGAYAHAPASIKVLPSGFLADTPEVASAKAAHLTEKAKVAAKATYAPAPYVAPAYAPYVVPYAGAYAHAAVAVLPSGFLADTPEVASAKAAHLAEKAKVASKAYYAPAPYAAPAYAAPAYAAPAYVAPTYAAPAYAAPAYAAPTYVAPAYVAHY